MTWVTTLIMMIPIALNVLLVLKVEKLLPEQGKQKELVGVVTIGAMVILPLLAAFVVWQIVGPNEW